MKYPYLLLDADNTLFDFDAGNRHAFHEVCARYDIPDTEESFQCYKRCNNAMWAAFDRGECTKDFLVVERFRRFLKEMGLDRDAARWFKRAFVYTGNIDDFRYRFEMDKDNGLLHTAVYTVYCFEVAKDVQQQDFPWDDQGVEQLKAWLQERYDHYTREGSL